MKKKCLYFCFLTFFITAHQPTLAEETQYDVILQSSIRGSAEQPKMLFILPWRSQIDRNLPLKKNLDGYFETLLTPVSKVDIEYQHRLMQDYLSEK